MSLLFSAMNIFRLPPIFQMHSHHDYEYVGIDRSDDYMDTNNIDKDLNQQIT